jgi:hypothetical protein
MAENLGLLRPHSVSVASRAAWDAGGYSVNRKDRGMSRHVTSRALALSRRGSALLVAVVSAAALYFSMAIGPVSNASAENFCSYIWAAPYGQPGDRCTASTWIWIYGVTVQTWEHSGCVDAVDVYNNLVRSWTCTPGGNTYINIFFPPNTVPRTGIIRNNTTAAGAHIAGNQTSY